MFEPSKLLRFVIRAEACHEIFLIQLVLSHRYIPRAPSIYASWMKFVRSQLGYKTPCSLTGFPVLIAIRLILPWFLFVGQLRHGFLPLNVPSTASLINARSLHR